MYSVMGLTNEGSRTIWIVIDKRGNIMGRYPNKRVASAKARQLNYGRGA